MEPIAIASPNRAAADPAYEADLKEILEPRVSQLLDLMESAGWDRKKVAYNLMLFAARNLSAHKETE
jgi:hypothetical protein